MLIQTAFEDEKLFVEIFEPYEYEDFIAAAAEEFNIDYPEEIIVTVNGTRIKSSQFKGVVLQYCNVPTFHVDLTTKDSVPCAGSASSSVIGTAAHNPSAGALSHYHESPTDVLPTMESIRSLKPVEICLNNFLNGKPLRNRDRVKIAKVIIDECLKDSPNRQLHRDDFVKLSQIIVEIFDTEIASAYYMPSVKSHPARGKLWSAYNNKRTAMSLNGLINRRSKPSVKRKAISPDTLEMVRESIQFLQENTTDWPEILEKWSETHTFRMSELRNGISTSEYVHKYPGLQETNGVDLVSLDVQMMYPSAATVDNWLTLYPKVISQARNLRDKKVMQLLEDIDNSTNERFTAQLALICIPYILPHCGKRSETGKNATKSEIQQRFIKDYKTIKELKHDTETADLQIRFVKEDNAAITYAEFTIADQTFKCVDLLEALNVGFMYIMALQVNYPKLCLHVWQFVQLSIFQIELPEIKVPSVETVVNDLFKD